MKREVMASVLLACMIFANPVYADDDRTPDEYNPDAKYESPLDQSYGPIVNDYRETRAEDENEAFAREAGMLVQGETSGKARTVHARGEDRVKVVPSAEKSAEDN